MRFYVGFINIIISLCIIVLTIYFLDFSILFENLIAAICFVVGGLFFYSGIWNLNEYYKNRRVKFNGLKVSAKILNINRTLLSVKNSPEFIIEVSYVHPVTAKKYVIYVDAYDKNFKQNQNNIEHIVQILVDPKDPNSAQLIEKMI